MSRDIPNLPGLGAPIPPTDPERAARFLHPRPGMKVGYGPGDPRNNPYLQQASHFQGQAPPSHPPGHYDEQGNFHYAPTQYAPQQPQGGQGVYPQYQHQQPQMPKPPEPDYVGAPPVRGGQVYTAVIDVTVNGKTYGIRDLGKDDATELYSILEEATTWGTNRATTRLGGFVSFLSGKSAEDAEQTEGQEEQPAARKGEAWILPILGPFLGFRYVKEELMALAASIFLHKEGALAGQPLTVEEFRNPNNFPLREEKKVYEALRKHPDLESFFGWFEARRAAPAAVFAHLTRTVNQVVEGMGQDPEQSGQSSTDGNESQ